MTKNKTIATLLKKERKAIGFTLQDVAEKVGFSNYQTLSDIESGKRELKAWELAKLAEIYGRKIEYFFGGVQEAPMPKVLWREPAQTPERARAERQFISFCDHYQKLLKMTGEDDNEAATFSFSGIDKNKFYKRGFDYVVDLAEECAEILHLGRRPAYALANVLEQNFGILVLFMDLGTDGSGASTVGDYGKAILINSADAPWRRNYNLAHELFHIITWNVFSDADLYSEAPQIKTKVEKWADSFASAILLPANEVRKEFHKRLENNEITYISLVEIAREFKVSIEAFLWRLVILNLLNRKDVSKFLEKGDFKDIDRKMRVKDWLIEEAYLSPRFITLAIKALQKGMISKSRFAEYVNRPFSEVSTFLQRYGYDENEDYSRAFAAS